MNNKYYASTKKWDLIIWLNDRSATILDSIIFENRYVISKDDMREIYNASSFKTSWFAILVVIFTVSCLVNLPELINGEQKGILQIINNICWFLIIIAILIIRNHLGIKNYFERENELYNGAKVENIIRIRDDYEIVNELTGGSQHIKFSQIVRIKEMKHFLLLMTSSKYPIYFRKDCFTIGTLDEFVEFICRKYPNYKFSEKMKKLRKMNKT